MSKSFVMNNCVNPCTGIFLYNSYKKNPQNFKISAEIPPILPKRGNSEWAIYINVHYKGFNSCFFPWPLTDFIFSSLVIRLLIVIFINFHYKEILHADILRKLAEHTAEQSRHRHIKRRTPKTKSTSFISFFP